MKTYDFIRLLEALDPNGVLEVVTSNAPDEPRPFVAFVDEPIRPSRFDSEMTMITPHKAIIV